MIKSFHQVLTVVKEIIGVDTTSTKVSKDIFRNVQLKLFLKNEKNVKQSYLILSLPNLSKDTPPESLT